MERFSDRMVPEVVQVFWAAMARGEFVTAAAAEAGTYREMALGGWPRQGCASAARAGPDGPQFDVRRARGDRRRSCRRYSMPGSRNSRWRQASSLTRSPKRQELLYHFPHQANH